VGINSSFAVIDDPEASGTSNTSSEAFLYKIKHLDSKPVITLQDQIVTIIENR
jgi:archaellum component FlaG (FlaF/FlaG flagellin family)